MGRRRLMLHFPRPSHPTRRIKTWSAPNIEYLGSFGRTLASSLPSCPQLTRPGRRVNLIYDGKTPVIKEEGLPEEIDPRQLPLLSIEEEPEGEAGPPTRNEAKRLAPEDESQQPPGEAQPEAVVEEPRRRTRRQAAIAGRQKMWESTAPPVRRTARGSTVRKTAAASSRGQQPETGEQFRVEIPAIAPEDTEEAEQATKARAKGKAACKFPAETKLTKAAKGAKAARTAPKKPGSKLRTQARSKATPKSKAVSKAARGSAAKKGKR